jgi:hypothetical protein
VLHQTDLRHEFLRSQSPRNDRQRVRPRASSARAISS